MFLEEKGNFYIRIESFFESSHYLYNYFPEGKDEACHGHSWKVEIYLKSNDNISSDGISFDFLKIRKMLNKLIDSIDHITINDHPDFSKINPTSENIARWFYYHLKKEVHDSNGKIMRIVIHEGQSNLAYFEPIDSK
ncbi:MAG: 6-carboxytetrahydropterin synthase [Leptospiraceae bacterium]|nr:6-carboxytetrahydropterin synthase [Leptospiraceae bacterium]MCK6381228.1 6-carboxytetrahydropterin synthase [Leptospiraceae bacterium]NUM40751.1 6-carboxytetrahydropterin synthase [Leptospiraceae bacterium]